MSTTALPIRPPTVTALDRLIAIKTGHCGGKPHIAGHRIKVQDVAIWHERLGQSPEEIVATYPTINLAQVHAALAYYHANRADIDADIAADEEFVAQLQANAGPSPLQRKLRESHAPDNSLPPG